MCWELVIVQISFNNEEGDKHLNADNQVGEAKAKRH